MAKGLLSVLLMAVCVTLASAEPAHAWGAIVTAWTSITASTASWLTAVYQYDPVDARMKVASSGGQTMPGGIPATATEAASISTKNFNPIYLFIILCR